MSHPRTKLPDSRVSPRFAGISTFCRYPLLESTTPDNRPVDWAIYGVPFDGGVTYRPGARFGPRAIRDASQYVKRYSIEHDVDICDLLSLADAGDAPVSPYSVKKTLDGVVEFTDDLGEPAHTKLMAIGGDHSIAYANIKATCQRRATRDGGLALIHFDSHLDTVDTVWDEKWTHASPFIRAIEDGLIDPKRTISIGIKGPLNTSEDLNYAKEKGVKIITFEQWRRSEFEGNSELTAFIEQLNGDEAYLSFDIDVVDPAYAPGTGTPSVGGFTSAQILSLLRSLRGLNIVGADVVEVLPDRDPAGITSLLAAHIMFEILALDAIRTVD